MPKTGGSTAGEAAVEWPTSTEAALLVGLQPSSDPKDLPGTGVTPGEQLPRSFFERDTCAVARELLGMLLLSRAGGVLTGGRIVETEAYLGADDPGSHAATRGMTKRNAVMYGPGGHAYVYFTYGNHHMLNLVTECEGTAGAVLIRALEPLVGLETIQARRNGRAGVEVTNGPGKLAAALGLDLSDNGVRLGEGSVTVLRGEDVASGEAATSGRVGLSAGHDRQLRYFHAMSSYVSKGRTGPVRSRARRSGGNQGGAK